MSAWDTPPGPQGPQGIQGIQGPQGPIGPTGGLMVAHEEVTRQLINIATESVLIAPSIPAGTVKAGDVLRLNVYGDFGNSSGVAQKFPTLRFYQGLTIVMDGTGMSATVPSSTTDRSFWWLDWIIQVQSLTSQRGYARAGMMNANAPGITFRGQQTGSSGGEIFAGAYESVSVNMANAMLMQLDATLPTAAATVDLRSFGYMIEKLPS
jgi:hypothetical protein